MSVSFGFSPGLTGCHNPKSLWERTPQAFTLPQNHTRCWKLYLYRYYVIWQARSRTTLPHTNKINA